MRKISKWLLRLLAVLLIFVCLGSMVQIYKRTSLPEKIHKTELYSLAHRVKEKLSLMGHEVLHKLQNEENQDDPKDGAIGGKGSGIINILFIGQDRRPGEESGRSDSMILCTFQPKKKTLTLTSFLRDLYVEIPGYNKNRINASFRFGGKDLLKETLDHNFDIHVDGTVQVDFDQFAEIIDVLGGVPITLRGDEAAEINRQLNVKLHEGEQVLDGLQALAYSRIRKLDPDSDFSRTDRQRKVLSAILDKVRTLDFKELMALAQQILPRLDTDIGYLTALRIGGRVLPMLKGMEVISQQIPADGEYQGQMINGMAVLVPNLEKTRQRLRDTLLP